MVRAGSIFLVLIPTAAMGCASITWNSTNARNRLDQSEEIQSELPSDRKDVDQKSDSEKEEKTPKTLLEWAIPATEKNGNNNGDEEEKRIDCDRPHLPEAASTVGLGRAILESGYTYTSKGPAFLHQHSYPEALLRIGMLAEWFELRITQNFINQRNVPGSGEPASINGAQDLVLGVKLGLTEQKQYMPEMALILQMTVPSGSSNASNDTVLPGVNLDMGWEIIKNCFGMETVTSANGARDDANHTYVNFAQGITAVVDLTSKLQGFTEYDLFVPIGAISPEATHPQHYLVGGFMYYPNNNVELDIRAGVGLNDHANDFLVGSGFGVRY